MHVLVKFFEDGDAQGFTFKSGYVVLNDSTNQALTTQGHKIPKLADTNISPLGKRTTDVHGGDRVKKCRDNEAQNSMGHNSYNVLRGVLREIMVPDLTFRNTILWLRIDVQGGARKISERCRISDRGSW